MVPLGISGAAATRVGNAIGRAGHAGRPPGRRRLPAARRRASWSSSRSLFGLLPEPLARLYTRDAAVIAMAATLLPIAAVFQVFDGVQVVGGRRAARRGGHDLSRRMAFVGFWGIGLPVGWYLAFRAGWGPAGLWWGITAGLAAVMLLYGLRIFLRFRGHIARETG